MNDADEMARRSQALVKRIEPMLAGQGPEVQGGVLADLTAIWLAGHHPSLRGEALARYMQTVVDLAVVNEKMMFGDAGFPELQ